VKYREDNGSFRKTASLASGAVVELIVYPTGQESEKGEAFYGYRLELYRGDHFTLLGRGDRRKALDTRAMMYQSPLFTLTKAKRAGTSALNRYLRRVS
jgi:hypothetical protein